MIKEIADLFRQDLIYIEDAKDSSEIFTKVGQKLIEKDLVKDTFIDGIIKRESEYPTGMDLSMIEGQKFNVAIPHTEREYCKSECVVFVKLKQEIEFKNMISPENSLKVKYLFMIINDKSDAQVNILSNIMDFITQKENLNKLDELQDEGKIYKFISGKEIANI